MFPNQSSHHGDSLKVTFQKAHDTEQIAGSGLRFTRYTPRNGAPHFCTHAIFCSGQSGELRAHVIPVRPQHVSKPSDGDFGDEGPVRAWGGGDRHCACSEFHKN